MASLIPEKNVIADVKRLLTMLQGPKKFDWFRINTAGTLRNGVMTPNRDSAGFADFIVLPYNALPFFLEGKSSVGRLSHPQVQFKNRVEAMGCGFYIIRSAEEVLEILRTRGFIHCG